MKHLDLSGVDPMRWAEIRARVAVIERFLKIEQPSEKERLAHAAELGLRRTQFMKLVRAWKAHGNASSIAGAGIRRRKTRVGWRALPKEAEQLMCATLERLGNDVQAVDAWIAVSDVLAKAGLPSPARSTVWRRLLTMRQAGGTVTEAGDVVVAECRILMPVVSSQGLALPSLLVAAHSSTGCILAAVLLEDEARGASRLGDSIRQALPDATVTIDQTFAASFGGGPEATVTVTAGIARRMLARMIGNAIGGLELKFNRTKFGPEQLLRTKEDHPLDVADARHIIAAAIERHNMSRGGTPGLGLVG